MEKVFDILYTIKTTIVSIFLWSYFGIGFCIWVYLLYSTIRYAQYSSLQLVYLVSLFVGLGALCSYLYETQLGTRGFWRGVLLLIPLFFLTATASWFVTLMYIIPLFPLLYAIYKLAFDDGFHELLCLFRKERLYKFDNAVMEYKKSEKFTSLSPLKQKLRLIEFYSARP